MSGGKARRRKQKAWLRNRRFARGSSLCLNCGATGPHFVPPSLGDPGFYICQKVDTTPPIR